MNVGFDVDGVLIDMADYQLKYGTPYFAKRNMDVINPRGYDVKDIFNCTSEEREKFWVVYIWKYCLFEPMTEGAAQLSHKLKSDGHKITVVTGRAHTTETGITGKLFRWMLKYWLKKNHFLYDEIFYCSEKGSAKDKVDICINNGIDLLIDDKPDNLILLKDYIPVICFSTVWNEEMHEFDAYRANDMNDVYQRILGVNIY